MNYEEIVEVMQKSIEAFNSQDIEKWFSLVTDDIFWSDPAMMMEGGPAVGRDAIRTFVAKLFKAFPDFHYEIIAPICVSPDGNTCAVPWRITVTNTGAFDPPGFAPTNGSGDTIEWH